MFKNHRWLNHMEVKYYIIFFIIFSLIILFNFQNGPPYQHILSLCILKCLPSLSLCCLTCSNELLPPTSLLSLPFCCLKWLVSIKLLVGTTLHCAKKMYVKIQAKTCRCMFHVNHQKMKNAGWWCTMQVDGAQCSPVPLMWCTTYYKGCIIMLGHPDPIIVHAQVSLDPKSWRSRLQIKESRALIICSYKKPRAFAQATIHICWLWPLNTVTSQPRVIRFTQNKKRWFCNSDLGPNIKFLLRSHRWFILINWFYFLLLLE